MDDSTRMKCEIVTPEGLIFDGDATMVTIPGEMGELGILPRHAPLVSRTKVGEVGVQLIGDGGPGGWEFMAVGSGYVKMQFDRLLLLVDTAEKAVDIDVERAQSAAERAEGWLAKAREVAGVDVHRAQQSRKRALNRLKVAGKRK